MSLVRKDDMDAFSSRAYDVAILDFDGENLLSYTVSHYDHRANSRENGAVF
jgi:hypothetical protein